MSQFLVGSASWKYYLFEELKGSYHSSLEFPGATIPSFIVPLIVLDKVFLSPVGT